VGHSYDVPAASRYPTAPGYPTEDDGYVSTYGKLPHEGLIRLDSYKKLTDLQNYVSHYLEPHFEPLICHGLNSSYHMHIDARITLGCSLATETVVAPAYKYSKCEAEIMRKFVLCQDGDHACYISMLENLATCLGVCCGDQHKLCQAAMCRGLERSFVDVKGGFAMCKAHVYPGAFVDENCPFLTPLWMDCAPWVTAARRGCHIPSELELVEDNCVKEALALGGHEECHACVDL